MGRLILFLSVLFTSQSMAQYFQSPTMIETSIQESIHGLTENLIDHDVKQNSQAIVREHHMSEAYCAYSQQQVFPRLDSENIRSWAQYLSEDRFSQQLSHRETRARALIELYKDIEQDDIHNFSNHILGHSIPSTETISYLVHALADRGHLAPKMLQHTQSQELYLQATLRRSLARQGLITLIGLGHPEPNSSKQTASSEDEEILMLAGMSERELLMALVLEHRKNQSYLANIDASLRLVALTSMAQLADTSIQLQQGIRWSEYQTIKEQQ